MENALSLREVQREYEQLADQLANTHISNFADEIILLIFQRLPIQSLLNARAVSRSWKYLAEDNVFWKEQISRVFFSRKHFSSFEQRTDLNYCSHIIRQKQIEAGLRYEPVEIFESGYLTQVSSSCITETFKANTGNRWNYIQPQDLEFQDNKLYLCRNQDRDWPTLLIQDRKTSKCEEVPLKLDSAKVDQYRDFEKKFSFVASTSEYLIFDVILDNHSVFFRSTVNKFCIYDRKSKNYLWESDVDEKCAEIMHSEHSFCIFSRIISKKNNTVTIRARDIQTGTILFESEYAGTVDTFTCALSGVLHFKINNIKEKLKQQYVIYYNKDDKSGNNFTTKRCRKVSNINYSGDILYLNKKIFLLKVNGTSYIEVSVREPQNKVKQLYLSQDTIWAKFRSINPKIEMIDFNGKVKFISNAEFVFDTLTFRYYVYEKYFIAASFPPYKHGYRIYDVHTGSIVKDMILTKESRIVGFENDLMIYFHKGAIFDKSGLVKVIDLNGDLREMSNKPYESFYKDGILFLQETRPLFGSPLWSYIDFTKFNKAKSRS